MANYLEVSGVNLSSYISKMTIDDEPIWNDSAGRALDAGFVGRVIARKWKINLATKPLTQEESAIIHNALKVGDFMKVKFIPPTSSDDTLLEKTFYVSPTSNTIYSYVNGIVRYESMSFNLIEQ